jgi:hypothetical protein
MKFEKDIELDHIMYPTLNMMKRPYYDWCMNMGTPFVSIIFFTIGFVFIATCLISLALIVKFIREYLI